MDDPRRRALLRGLALLPWLTSATALAGLSAGRTVVDLAGRRVTLPERCERIAAVGGSPAVNAFLFLFGLGGRLVNGLPANFNGPAWRWQRFFAPALAQLPVVSGPPPGWAPNVEALLALQPELVFTVSTQVSERLQALGLPAITLAWERPGSIAETVRLLAEITDQPERAAAYFAWEQGLREQVRQGLRGAGPSPRVLYCRWQGLTQPIMTPANELIAAAGGVSVTAADNPLHLDVFPFSAEQLLAWQPEAILLASATELPSVYADARFAQLPAVRARRVWAVPQVAHLWTHYTPEQPLGVLWLAHKLFPGRFSRLEPLAESRRFYQQFFGKTPADTELRVLLGLS